MSFIINGETWQPKTAIQHADLIIDKINELLQNNNITDKDGNVVQLKKNYGNALYLLSLGDGQRFAENDAALSKGINSFNVELCDDHQIENLLPIAAIDRNPGSYSTLKLTVTASSEGDCFIPAGTKAPYEDMNFVVQNDVLLTAGATQLIETVADVLGPIVVLSGEITSFENEIANLESVVNDTSSVPGTAADTITDLRNRIIKGDTIKYSLNGCKLALETLTGVTHAMVYFNYKTNETITLPGNVVLQPRTAYVVIQGSSDKIAETYSEYMSAQTQNDPNGEGTYSTVNITITTTGGGSATLSADTTATYNGNVFKINGAVTIAASTQEVVPFTCTEWGAVEVPALGIQALDQTITNVESAQNLTAAVPGSADPKHQQSWITNSGQEIPIKYDDAKFVNIFIKVYLERNAEWGDEVENQIKKDLIAASAKWEIGDSISQVDVAEPFINCSYTKVAYAKISADGITWGDYLDMGCNEVPRVVDGTISVEPLEE